MKSNQVKDYAVKANVVNIQWDTNGEDVNLPTQVEIPFYMDGDDIAGMLSDEYGFCVLGFNIEQVEVEQ